MGSLYFPPTELPEGYVHDGTPLQQKTILVSGYDVNGVLFLEPPSQQALVTQDGANASGGDAVQAVQKKKRKIGKQSVMSVYAPRFPISWLSNISPEIKTVLEQYLFSLPRAALPRDTAQLSDFYNGNLFELTNQTKVPTCAEISKNPVDLLTKVLNIRKSSEFLNYYDIHIILIFAVQTPFTIQTIEQMRNFFTHTTLLRPDPLFSALSPSDPQRRCISLLASDTFLRPLITSLTRIISDSERAKRIGDIISYLSILYTQYKNILKTNLFCDALSILLTIPEGESFALPQYNAVLTYICSIIKAKDYLTSTFTTEMSRAGINKKIMLLIDAITELPVDKNKYGLVLTIKKLIFILAHMRYSEHGSRNLPTGQYMAEYKERAKKLSATLDILLAGETLAEESEEISEDNLLEEGSNVGLLEAGSHRREILMTLYDKKSPPLATYIAMLS